MRIIDFFKTVGYTILTLAGLICTYFLGMALFGISVFCVFGFIIYILITDDVEDEPK